MTKWNNIYTNFDDFKSKINVFKTDIVQDSDNSIFVWLKNYYGSFIFKGSTEDRINADVFTAFETYKYHLIHLTKLHEGSILNYFKTINEQINNNTSSTSTSGTTQTETDGLVDLTKIQSAINAGGSNTLTSSEFTAIMSIVGISSLHNKLKEVFDPLFFNTENEDDTLFDTSQKILTVDVISNDSKEETYGDNQNLINRKLIDKITELETEGVGEKGEKGDTGPAGPQGPPGADGVGIDGLDGQDGQPHAINDKIFAKAKDVFTKPQINARFEGLFRSEDLLLNRDTVSWTAVPSASKLQSLVSVLKTESEYYSLVKEGYGSNVVSQPFSLNVNDKVDIYQICNFKNPSCVLKDIWSHWRSPANWFDLTEFQQHTVLLQWVNRICGSNYELSNYIKPDGSTDVLSHIIHIKRSDLGQIYRHFRNEDTDWVTEIQHLSDTPEKYSELNNLTEAEFYTQIGHNAINVTSTVANPTSIESFHSWSEQITDDQIDFFRRKIPEFDRTKLADYNVYDLFNDHEDIMIVAYKRTDGSLVVFNLMRNDNVFSYNSVETVIITGFHHISTLPSPFNTQRANLNLKYVNSLYSWIEDYNNHVISEPDPDNVIVGYYTQRFDYIAPESSNYPMVAVLTDKNGTIFGVKLYDWGKEYFELKGTSYTKNQIDAQLDNRFSALETEVVDNEMLPYDATTNPVGLKWDAVPNINQRQKLLQAFNLPDEIWGAGSYLENPYTYAYNQYIYHYKFFSNENNKYYVFNELRGASKTAKLKREKKISEILGKTVSTFTYLYKDDVEKLVNSRVYYDLSASLTKTDYSTPEKFAKSSSLTKERFFHFLKVYAKSDQKVKGQKMIENLGNTDIKLTPWKELGNSSLYPTMRERLEVLHTPHPWIEVSGSGTTISLFDHSKDIPGTAYYASVGEKVGFQITNKYGQELKRFNNSWFFRLYSTGTQQLKDGLYKFDIHIEPPQNTNNVVWNSFFVPEQFQDTTSKLFQNLAITDNINPNSSTTKTYFHSTLKSGSPWQLKANVYNSYFATKTGINIKGNIKWTKSTGDLLYWGEIWWLTNSDVYKHPFFVYYHMRNNVALQSLRWTFDANGSFGNAKPTKFNFSMVRESGH